jgi:hypothetical protein
MRLEVPGIPFELVVNVVRKPPASRWKCSVRGLLMLVVISAFSTWCGILVFDRYACKDYSKSYYVGDLVHLDSPQQMATELPKFAELLKSSTPPDRWSSRNRSITPFFLSVSLIVRDSESGHQRVADWLRERRTAESK